MELIRTLTQMVHSLRARGIRRRVAVVCPKDSHTEYVIIRALREEIAEFLLVSDTADMEMAYHYVWPHRILYESMKQKLRMPRRHWLWSWCGQEKPIF